VFLARHLSPVCPSCGQSDRTYKVSLLYVAASARLNHQEMEAKGDLDAVLSALLPEGSDRDRHGLLQRLVKKFSPPASQRQFTRTVHPDWYVLFGCAIGLFFSYQLAMLRSNALPVIISLIIVGVLVYWISRRAVLSRYHARLDKEKEASGRLDLATARWMGLFYCSRDGFVFDPERQLFVPVEQLGDLLYDRIEKSTLPHTRRME